MKYFFLMSLITLSVVVVAMPSRINIDHLEKNLAHWFYLNGEHVKGYWVYAEKRDDRYIPTTAVSEGDFCVDDVARVVVLYCEAYEVTKSEDYLKLALDAVKFVLKMQADDGEFYNFAYADGTINQYGNTSKKSTSWWALRAFWALGKLYNVSKDSVVLDALQKAFKAISKNPPIYNDQKALYLLGLCEYNKVSNVARTIEAVARELQASLRKKGIFEGFFSWNTQKFAWNGWGNRYAEALLEAYKATGIQSFLSDAVESLRRQIPLLLGTGFLYSVDKAVKRFPELSYAVETLSVAAAKAYHLTGDEQMAYLCALANGWYFGLNRLKQAMLGPGGEGYDGMEYMHINHNAGAESTICAQRSILYLSTLPELYQKLAVSSQIIGTSGLLILEAEAADPGISSVSLVVGDFSAGAALGFSGKARLRWTVSELKKPVYVAVSGSFKDTKITVTSGNSASAELSGEGIFEIGKIELATTVRVSLDGEGVLDQLILVPEMVGISIDFDGRAMTVSYFQNQGLQIINEVVFYAEKDLIAQQIIASYTKEGRYLLLNLDKLFNNDGIGSREKPANFDNLGGIVGSYYSAEFFAEGVTTVEQVPFLLKVEGNDNIRCNLQKIIFEEPIMVKKIHLLCAANHGNYAVNIWINDQPLKIVVKDWCAEQKSIQYDYRFIASGEKQFIKCGIDKISLDVEKIVESIVLPEAINVHVFAMTLEIIGE